MDVIGYYKNPIIRERINEYAGVENPVTEAEFIVGLGAAVPELRNRLFGKKDGKIRSSFPLENLPLLLDKGQEIYPAAWRKSGAWVLLDVEYHNQGYEKKVYHEAYTVYEMMEPLYQQIQSTLKQYEVDHMTIMTGQGYHFTWFVPSFTEAHQALREIGNVMDPLKGKYDYVGSGSRRKRPVPLTDGLAFSGSGRLCSYLAYKIIKEKDPNIHLPITICDTLPGNRDRECFILDLSWYTDPIFTRVSRSVFGTHNKSGSPLLAVPRHFMGQDGKWHDEPLEELLDIRRNAERTIKLAKKVDANIPFGARGTKNLIREYTSSPLYSFHREMDNTPQEKPENWKNSYWLWPRSGDKIPPCIQHIVDHPNPEMLRPQQLQALIRTMYGLGWRHKDIAGFIRSKYESNYDWANTQAEGWKKYDAATRAETWTELFMGAIVEGADNQGDHNCVSHQEKGLCVRRFCGSNLADFKKL